jgi:hypothetical protein
MRLEELKERYRLRNLPDSEYETAAATIRALDEMMRAEGAGEDCDTLSKASLDRFIATLVRDGKNTEPVFVGLLRYYFVTGRNDLYIRLTQYTGGDGVVDQILDRLQRIAGEKVRKEVADGLAVPPLGTPPEALPAFTDALMARLRGVLSDEDLEKVLSGNNHGVPDAAFAAEKTAFETALTFEDYLADYHRRQVATLQEHADSGKPWYEQHITQEVVDFVASQPEIQGGVLKDGIVYETKIPYDIESWLHAKTPEEQRYYACHCPFARERIREGGKQVDALWCHCSGGFVKRRYEVLFGRPLRAKCLANALQGDQVCRFAIDLRDVPYRR